MRIAHSFRGVVVIHNPNSRALGVFHKGVMHIPQKTDNSPGPSTPGVIRRAVVPAVLVMFFLICAGSPQSLLADPISFEITWALSAGGPAPATTTYTYDPVTGLFAGFVVAWNG